MLKALELRGFKSFADKTRFDFPSGITVVVGPNGSGKSNIVDAIKWVLGEQSAKSLRGKEMADVIFKGAGDGGRKPANAAEATIVFDNTAGRLAVEAPEVYVTRRVYRSGEGEYLINRQACRLRDVKDLFRGTGVGADAYSLIEQGKVDTLLQASLRDRRAIFEEAAGISRFKAKKVEAQRRLERVDQNLLRLSDIVEEVEHRLRTVRSQASKANRYRQYTERLQQLRTQVGQVDWRRLTENLRQIEGELQQLEQESGQLMTAEESLEARASELEREHGSATEALRACESRLARHRERIAAHESTTDHEYGRLRESAEEVSRSRRQLAAMSTRAGDLETELKTTSSQLREAEDRHRKLQQEVNDHERSVDRLTEQLETLRRTEEEVRSQYVAQVRASADLGSQISADQSELNGAESRAERLRDTLVQVGAELQDAETELHALQQEVETLEQNVRRVESVLEQVQHDIERSRSQWATQQDRLGQLKGTRTGCREKADVLAELEARLEGVHAGVREVLARARDDVDGPFAGVHGILADLIQVSVETAGMVDVGLGERSQHVVVAGSRMLEYLQANECRWPGRVGFLWLVSAAPRGDAYRVDLAGKPGVIGRGDQFVETAPEYQRLVHWLLGDTWFVETLPIAIELRQSVGRGVRFVTRRGELLDRDGSLVVGPCQTSIGLVSRRSQLRSLRKQIERLDAGIDTLERANGILRKSIEQKELQLQQLRDGHEQAITDLNDQRLKVLAAFQRRQQLDQRRIEAQDERQTAESRQRVLAERLASAQQERERIEFSVADLNQRLEQYDQEIQTADAERQQAQQTTTMARVDAAKSEQQLESMLAKVAQLERDQEERVRALDDARTQLERGQQRFRETERGILHASTQLAELYLHLEADSQQLALIDQRRELLQQDRAELAEQIQHVRRKLRIMEERQHSKQLEASKAAHERDTLAQRLRDDYGIEIADLEDIADEEEQHQREAVDQEITELRRKISNIGAVNLEALAELEELESRYNSLSQQYRDLVDAKESLERIIQRINADSRRLFTETLEAIRANFQELFRKVFGGGRADIRLEEGVDILECGVDIVATPPGKQSLSLSLLSGGERALTAVTLLLAIFQYRPSPFCVLDEVDGPLDEANIGRFIQVLEEFLEWTKFVVVTHSKKTMTAATTLYGITMQESGVSKRVSVQFEDVTEDGHIRREALDRQATAAPSDEDGRGAA